MHPNPAFRGTAQDRAREFAANRGFGILSINGADHPLNAHVPFVIHGDRLRAHLVGSNPVWRALNDGPVPALISVSGPDSYVSPDWYGVAGQVPTWNYVAVNLVGTLRQLPQTDLPGILDDLSGFFERRLLPKPVWTSDKVPADALERMMRQIRPVELQIASVDSTFKLGQNKPDEARRGAAEHMQTDGIGMEVRTLAALMAAIQL